MEETKFDLQAYMSKNIEALVSNIIKNTFKNPKESIFMLKFAKASKRARSIKKASKKSNQRGKEESEKRCENCD